jgi:hypothetical protein
MAEVAGLVKDSERAVWPEEVFEPTEDERPDSSIAAAHVSRHEPMLVGHVAEGIRGLSFSSRRPGHLATMDKSHRVCFDFAGEKQVQYVTQLPSVGDFVTHIGALWVVERVDEDDAGPVVRCSAPKPVLQRP